MPCFIWDPRVSMDRSSNIGCLLSSVPIFTGTVLIVVSMTGNDSPCWCWAIAQLRRYLPCLNASLSFLCCVLLRWFFCILSCSVMARMFLCLSAVCFREVLRLT